MQLTRSRTTCLSSRAALRRPVSCFGR